ncbi:MAG TPA: hypothetical protein VL832_15430, partial [Puia sp.]|nr:hypothetical protein [Puia sp.]
MSARTYQQQDTTTHRKDTVGLDPSMYLRQQADSARRAAAGLPPATPPPSPMSRSAAAPTRRPTDTIKPAKDTLHFPLCDRRGDRFSNENRNRNPFDLKDPPNLHDSIAYDPVTRLYYIYVKIGNQYYRKPTYLTFDEL